MSEKDLFPQRAAALAELERRGEVPVHAKMQATRGHGHGGLCCCIMASCRSDACSVNAEIVRRQDVDR